MKITPLTQSNAFLAEVRKMFSIGEKDKRYSNCDMCIRTDTEQNTDKVAHALKDLETLTESEIFETLVEISNKYKFRVYFDGFEVF